MKKSSLVSLSLLITAISLQADAPHTAGCGTPARVTLEGKPDLFAKASFTYWDIAEDGLDLANSAMFTSNGPGNAYQASATSNSIVLNQDSGYTPGFQVGLGGSVNDWTLGVNYTWIKQRTHVSQGAPTPSPNSGTAIWVPNNWFQQTTSLGQTIVATDLSSKWKLRIDLADLVASRPYRRGHSLTVSPFFGLRAAWIRQKLTIDLTIPSTALPSLSSLSTSSYNTSHAWGLGPRAGLAAEVLLPMNFTIEGALAASLLFTQYTKVYHSEQVASYAATPSFLQSTLSDYHCVRPIAEMGAGLGWKSYLFDRKYYIDFLASYDFMYFWDQNMMRKLMDQKVVGASSSGNAISIQGLTLSARFDF